MRSVPYYIKRALSGLGIALTLIAACVQGEELKSNHSSRRNHGSAGVLCGSVLIYNLYLSDAESSWSAQERQEVERRLQAAAEFLAAEARKYDVPLQIKQETAAEVMLQRTIPTEMFADPQWTEQAAEATGAAGANALVARLKDRHEVQHVLLALQVDKAGLSHNLTYYETIDPLYRAERIVCYMRYPDGRPTAAASYAHEILHNFGAGELYFPFDKHDRRKKIAGRRFPHDVMFRVDYDLKKLNVGRYTAFRVGWLKTLEEEDRIFEDFDRPPASQ